MAGIQGVEVRESSIRVHFTLDGEKRKVTLKIDGKPIAPTQANIKHAQRLVRDVRDAIRLGTFSMAEFFPQDSAAGTSLTVATQLDDWLDAQLIEASTKAGYSSAIKFWKSVPIDREGGKLGDKALRALRPSDVKKAVAKLGENRTGKTINNYVSVLREALELAVEDGLLPENPADTIKRAAHQSPPPDPFDRDEVEKIIGHFAAKWPGQAHNLVEFWFWTGLRTSEVFALQWGNTDLNKNTILVAEASVRGAKKANTKTNTARTVKLNSRALAALTRQRQHTQVAGGAVFQHPSYLAPWDDERAFRRSFWTPTLKALGIRYRRPYNMRHSYATAMLMAGMTPAFCAKQLGHSIEMFHKHYAKWLDGEANDRELARLEATLGGEKFPGSSPKTGSGT